MDYLKDTYDHLLYDCHRFVKKNPVRQAGLKKFQQEMGIDEVSLKKPGHTRWLSRCRACQALYKSLKALLSQMDASANDVTGTERTNLQARRRGIGSFNFFATTYLFCDVLLVLNILSQRLQASTLSFSKVVASSADAIARVEKMINKRDKETTPTYLTFQHEITSGLINDEHLVELQNFTAETGHKITHSNKEVFGRKIGELALSFEENVALPFLNELLKELKETFATDASHVRVLAAIDTIVRPRRLLKAIGNEGPGCLVRPSEPFTMPRMSKKQSMKREKALKNAIL